MAEAVLMQEFLASVSHSLLPPYVSQKKAHRNFTVNQDFVSLTRVSLKKYVLLESKA